MKIRFLKGDNYIQLFNFSNGQALMLEKDAFVYRKEGPLLLDVSITNRCERQCDFCYRKSQSRGYDMPIEDYAFLLSQAKQCGVQQIAIGGGEPTLHPNFIDFLEQTVESGIIPNYSTNADYLSDEVLIATKKHCGAMAVSIYGNIENYKDAIERISNFGIVVNLHMILRSDLISSYTTFLKNPPKWLDKVNAIIFLNYKPADGKTELCLNRTPKDVLVEFFHFVANFKTCGVGFDTCSVSFVSNYLQVDSSLFDYCEAARKSAYINEKLMVYPCSFYTARGTNLKEATLYDIWNSSTSFKSHRDNVSRVCKRCECFSKCHYGCTIYDINNCNQCREVGS
jgi:radical SAM protein with 4Fe4S-binding SPASM domain